LNFTEKDIEQINQKGLTIEKIKTQIELFKTGVPFVNLKEAATVNNGILRLDAVEKEHFIDLFDKKRNEKRIQKFVPASGAATRMFKFLFQFLENYNPTNESINSYINRSKSIELSMFLVALEKLPFFEEVIYKTHEHVPNFNELPYDKQRLEFIKTILIKERLNYSFSPKGLLPFHKYKEHASTAFPRLEAVALDAGHWLHAEQPQAFDSAVCAFLNRQVS
jgi:hypothetical protein